MDPPAELVSDNGGDPSKDVDIDAWRLGTFDPPDIGVGDARRGGDGAKPETGRDPGATELLADPSKELSPPTRPALTVGFTSLHDAILA